MKKSISLFLITSLALTQASTGLNNEHGRYSGTKAIPSGCTVITVSRGESVFFAGNDDFINPDSYFWVEQGDSSAYGVVWIGNPDNPQQGINEKGLAYDSNGLPRYEVNPHTERTPFKGKFYHEYLMQIMHECSTVEEVINWVNAHQRFPYMHDQMHFADKKGDAVIISAGKDGEMVFTRKQSGDGFLVSTNFNVANTANSYGYPCQRYEKASELLTKIIGGADTLNFRNITGVMDAVHQERQSWTIETMVTDLVRGVMYLYYFYQYDDPVIININEELADPREEGPLSRLFPENVREEAANRYRQATKAIRINNITGRLWAVLIFISLILLMILPSRSKGLRFWLPAVIVLGPVALLVKVTYLDQGKRSAWRIALTETLGNMVPVCIAFLPSLAIMIVKAVSGGISPQQQVLLVFGIPLLASWLIFHSPLLASAGKKNFLQFLFQRLPQVLTVTFLGLAGVFPVAMPLVNRSVAMSQIMPLSPWIVMTWWVITVAGSLAGGLLVFGYEYWAVKRGYQAWNIFAGKEGEFNTPGWKKIWWWVVLSVLIIFAGLIASVILLKTSAG